MLYFAKQPSFISQRGVSFIELAVVLVFLVPLVLLTIDLSYTLYEYQTLVKQVRAGARYLSVQPPLSSSDTGTAAVKQKANCIVRTGTLDCSLGPLLPQLSNTSIVIINDSETDPSLKMLLTTSAGSSSYATSVNLVEVKVVGYVHNFIRGMTSINFPPITARMRQTN